MAMYQIWEGVNMADMTSHQNALFKVCLSSSGWEKQLKHDMYWNNPDSLGHVNQLTNC